MINNLSFSSKKIKNNLFVFSLTNKNGMEVMLSNYGATLLSLYIPTSKGKIDVLLGFSSVEEHIRAHKLGLSPLFNCVVGRFAGRIKNAEFSLNNKTIFLDKNHGQHHIHGGNYQLGNTIWQFSEYNTTENSITLTYLSKENEYYPGDVTISVTYYLTNDNQLKIKYIANTTQDTLLNLTNHAYFNLDGIEGNVTQQHLKINADEFLELDQDKIPTGNFIKVDNHIFDFRIAKNVIAGIDHCFVIKNNTKPCAVLSSKKNNITMKVFTTEPGVQIYVGGKVSDELETKKQVKLHTESGICFETQLFPDSPNHTNFPNAILRKEDTYIQETVFEFNF